MRKYTSFIVMLIAGLFLLQDASWAIPAFARKYRMSCSTCHAPIPRLKAYGDDFAGNGFVLADQDAPRYYVDTGDPLLSLIRDFPLAVRLDGFITYNTANADASDFGAPYGLKLMSGGEFTDDIAYYFYFYMSERGEVAGVEDAYIMFNNLFDTELDLYVGQFQVSDPLFKRELRLPLEDYAIYTSKVGMSNASLKYDRGIMLTYGFETGTDIMVEVVNGNGIHEADANHLFDNDNNKDFVGRISQDIGDFLRLGFFGYTGRENLTNDLGRQEENETLIYGPDLTISFDDKVEINGQYLMRNDDKLFITGADLNPTLDVETNAALIELIVMPWGDDSRWYFDAMYNWRDSDYDAIDYQSATFHVGHLVSRNLRLVGEVTYDLEMEFAQVGVGFVSAF